MIFFAEVSVRLVSEKNILISGLNILVGSELKFLNASVSLSFFIQSEKDLVIL